MTSSSSGGQEVVVVLSADGKPVTIVRSRQNHSQADRSFDEMIDIVQDPSASSCQLSTKKCSPAAEKDTAALVRESKGKEFEEQTELKRLRTENRLLKQRLENLEEVLNKRRDERSNRRSNDANDEVTSSSAANPVVIAAAAVNCSAASDKSCSATSSSTTSANIVADGSDNEVQRIQDELIACKLREAEANLSMKEFQQKLGQLERHWQQFLQENRCRSTTSEADLKETVMALRLRETYLVCDVNTLKQQLMELETQNHIYERQIKRQEAEHNNLQVAISAAELRERELQNKIVQMERKLNDYETKFKEDSVMNRIREAEYSQQLAEMRRRVAELEIENQELVTKAKLHSSRDGALDALVAADRAELQYQVKGVDIDVDETDDVDSCSVDYVRQRGASCEPITSLLLTDSFIRCDSQK